MKIEVRIYVDGEPVYGRITDIFPAPAERGGYILIAEDNIGVIESGQRVPVRRKVWFPDPADEEVAAAKEVAMNFRAEENRIRTESQKAEQRLNLAMEEARRKKAERLRAAKDIPEVTE